MKNISCFTAVEQYIKILSRKYKYGNISKIDFIITLVVLKDDILPFFKNYNLNEINDFEINLFFKEYNKEKIEQITNLIFDMKNLNK